MNALNECNILQYFLQCRDTVAMTVRQGRLDGIGASLLANPTVSREILMLGTVRTIREQARSYRHNRGVGEQS